MKDLKLTNKDFSRSNEAIKGYLKNKREGLVKTLYNDFKSP